MQTDVSEGILACGIHPVFYSRLKYPSADLSAKVIGNCTTFELPGRTMSGAESNLVSCLAVTLHCWPLLQNRKI